MPHRYPTRFQARLPSKALPSNDPLPSTTTAPRSIYIKQEDVPREDVLYIKSKMNEVEATQDVYLKMECLLDMLRYLIEHPALLSFESFNKTLLYKLADFRDDIKKRKELNLSAFRNCVKEHFECETMWVKSILRLQHAFCIIDKLEEAMNQIEPMIPK